MRVVTLKSPVPTLPYWLRDAESLETHREEWRWNAVSSVKSSLRLPD